MRWIARHLRLLAGAFIAVLIVLVVMGQSPITQWQSVQSTINQIQQALSTMISNPLTSPLNANSQSINNVTTLGYTAYTVATLPAEVDGKSAFASDGTPGSSPCVGGGTGAIAVGENGQWACLGVGPTTSVTMGGDVTGPSNASVVSKVNGVAVSGTPAVGYVPTATSATTATWQASGGGTPGGSNLQAQYNNSSVFGGAAALTFNSGGTLATALALGANASQLGQGVYLMPAFIDVNGANNTGAEQALRFLMSPDGQNWNALDIRSVYSDPSPPAGAIGGALRDPSCINYLSVWYCAYTYAGNLPDTNFGFISAPSLNGPWTKLESVSLSGVTNSYAVWAPQWFLDSSGVLHVLVAVSTSTLTTNFQIYEIHPTSAAPFNASTTWSTPVAITGTSLPTDMIDPYVVYSSGTYYLFFKNDASGSRQVEVASSSSLLSGYIIADAAVTPANGNCEGPTVLPVGSTWAGWCDQRTDLGMQYFTSSSLTSGWSALTKVKGPFPYWNHGNVMWIQDVVILRDMLAMQMAAQHPAGAWVTTTTAQSLANNTGTFITFASGVVEQDDDGFWNAANPTQLTAPAPGWYTIVGRVEFAGNATGMRILDIVQNYANGATAKFFADQRHMAISNGAVDDLTTEWIAYMNTGDYFQINAYQSSGAALNVNNADFEMVRMGGY